jgi:hypothetical protein
MYNLKFFNELETVSPNVLHSPVFLDWSSLRLSGCYDIGTLCQGSFWPIFWFLLLLLELFWSGRFWSGASCCNKIANIKFTGLTWTETKCTRDVLNFVTQSSGMLWCEDALVAWGRCDIEHYAIRNFGCFFIYCIHSRPLQAVFASFNRKAQLTLFDLFQIKITLHNVNFLKKWNFRK